MEQTSTRNRQSAGLEPKFLERLHALQGKLKKLADMVSKAEELAANIECELAALVTEAEHESPAMHSGDMRSSRSVPRTCGRNPRVRRLHGGVAQSLRIASRPDGTAVVQVDRGAKMVLAATLARLLIILSTDNDRSDDGVVGWKTFEEVAILMEKKTGRRHSRGAVNQLIYRLRKEFMENGASMDPIQTSRKLGMRFALKRSDSPGVIVANHISD